MNRLYALLTLLVLLTVPASKAVAQAQCPPDDPRSRALVERFVTRDELLSERVVLGVPQSITTSDIRVLSTATDSDACQRLKALIGPKPEWVWSAYRVGSFYFVAFRRISQGTLRIGFAPLLVFDQNLTFRDTYAM